MSIDLVPVRKALISVSDKSGLEPLCAALAAKGVELFATSGTAAHLKKAAGLSCRLIESLTQFPEMMDGRVKTLHPKIFGGVLARRSHGKDLEEAKQYEVPLFDLVIVNLYPFSEHLGEPPSAQSAFVDIGGPSLLRAASKNFEGVTVLSDPADYAEFLVHWDAHDGATLRDFRFMLAGRTFLRTSAYDAMIASQWAKAELPQSLLLQPRLKLRYGENPHQNANWCASGAPEWKVLQGKELSFNNLLDAESAVRLVAEFTEPACAIVKHNNPCGAAIGPNAFQRAFDADSKSAFGGIVATNQIVDKATAEKMLPIFLEVIVAPEFTPEALALFGEKKNLRLVEWKNPKSVPYDVRASLGGFLVQSADTPREVELKIVTTKPVPSELSADLLFAWKVCKHVRSNGIVLAKNGATLGIGGGQTSRVDAVEIALKKTPPEKLSGSVLASDAFFPFRDNIDLLRGTGVRAIIQPGGSQRDPEVIEACNETGIAMVFTGMRHFRH